MKILQRVNSKLLILFTALILAVMSLFTGLNLTCAAKANAETTNITYVDTQVESISFYQGGKVIFAFCLTESDYDEHGQLGTDFFANEAIKSYLTSLGYWKNFPSMNSEGVEFNQAFAYWNGGSGASSIGSKGENAVAHQTSLVQLEYGFLIHIPAGTTFPSLTYVVGNCVGEPVAYKTTNDVAFAFDGSKFVKVDYNLVFARAETKVTLDATNLSLYYPAEQTLVRALIVKSKASLGLCLSVSEVEKVLKDFNAELATIQTIEDYEVLAEKKNQAKQAFAEFFASVSESEYGEAEWQVLTLIQSESEALIDSAANFEAVEKVLAGIMYKAQEVLKESEKPAFEGVKADAMKRIEDAFVVSLYREAEAAQGAALVAEGKTMLMQATTYGEADAIELSYLAKIDALKTAAEWEAEEQANQNTEKPQPEPQQPPVQNSSTEQTGCNSSIDGVWQVICLAMVCGLSLMIKNKKRMGSRK